MLGDPAGSGSVHMLLYCNSVSLVLHLCNFACLCVVQASTYTVGKLEYAAQAIVSL